ncbi:MAG: hypothetical protein AAB663_01310 [Patescibacteria group bacterium]
MRFRLPITVIGLVLGFHALGMWKLYGFWHWYDMPMHFLGGVAMALLAWATWDMFVRDIKFTVRYPAAKRVAFMLWLVGFTAIIGIGWEWFEFGFDRFVLPTLQGWAPAQASITDTMADFFFDLSGAVAVSLLRRKV